MLRSFALALVACSAAAQPAAGVCLSLSQEGVSYAATALSPIIAKASESIVLTPISIDEDFGVASVKGSINDVQAKTVQIGSLAVAIGSGKMQVHAGGVTLNAVGTSALTIDIVFVKSHCNGPVTVSASDSSLDFSMTVVTGADGRPQLAIPDKVSVSLNNLDVHFGCGGIDGDIINDIIRGECSRLPPPPRAYNS
jgi:hypothetical protein